MDDDKILIDRKTLKAISSDTRLDILKSLLKRKRTLSELSKKLNLTSPTIKEHIEHLIDSNLVIKENTDSKWKYYSLTEKGKKLLNPKEIRVLISFVISLVSTFGLIGYYLLNFASRPMVAGSKSYAAEMVMDSVMTRTVDYGTQMSSQVMPIASTSSFNKEIILILAIFILFLVTVFFLVLLVKNRNKKSCIEII